MWSSPLCNSATSLKTDGFGGEKKWKKQRNSKLKIKNWKLCINHILFLLSKDIFTHQNRFENSDFSESNQSYEAVSPIVFDSLLLPQTVGIPPLFILSNLLNRKLF